MGLLTLGTSGQCEYSSKIGQQKNAQAIAHTFDLSKLDQLENLGYERSNGGRVNHDSENELFVQSYCVINRDNFPAKPVVVERCVIVIETLVGRSTDGIPTFKNDSALQIDIHGNRLFDTGDTNCSSSSYPNLAIFAVGQWAWKKRPHFGGYAHSIKMAWAIDPVKKNFMEIPATSVKCEVSEDRD
ncbi:MAG: hypothetical protein WA632_01045 [Gallionella sp.]